MDSFHDMSGGKDMSVGISKLYTAQCSPIQDTKLSSSSRPFKDVQRINMFKKILWIKYIKSTEFYKISIGLISWPKIRYQFLPMFKKNFYGFDQNQTGYIYIFTPTKYTFRRLTGYKKDKIAKKNSKLLYYPVARL